MKFGIFYEHQLPRPWDTDSEYRLIQDALEQIEYADRIGIEIRLGELLGCSSGVREKKSGKRSAPAVPDVAMGRRRTEARRHRAGLESRGSASP